MAEPAANQPELPKGTLARLGALAWQALPAIAGAIGVLGFVTLVGGGIVWTRFWSAGLPADQAVRAMPRQELITIGAVSLVSFAIAGLLVVLLLYLLDHNGDASVGTFRGLVVLAVAEWLMTLLVFTELGHWEWALGVWFILASVVAYLGLQGGAAGLEVDRDRDAENEPLLAAWREFRDADDRQEDARNRMALSLDAPPLQWPAEHYRRAGAERLREQREWSRALDRWIEQLEETLEAQLEKEKERDEEEPRPAAEVVDAARALSRLNPPAENDVTDVIDRARTEARKAAGIVDPSSWRRPAGIKRGWVLLALALLLPVIVLLWKQNGDDEIILASVAGLIVLLGAGTFAVARITTRFAWYGVAALASLVLFGAGANIVKTIREPQVQPVALVRKSDGVTFCGVYVTETDKRLYVGRLQGDTGDNEAGADSGAGRMFSIPLDDIEVFTVGPIQDMEDADWRARFLVTEVSGDKLVKPPPAPDTKKVTTKDSRERGLVTTTSTVEDVVPPEDPNEDGMNDDEKDGEAAAPPVRPPAECWRRDVSEAKKP